MNSTKSFSVRLLCFAAPAVRPAPRSAENGASQDLGSSFTARCSRRGIPRRGARDAARESSQAWWGEQAPGWNAPRARCATGISSQARYLTQSGAMKQLIACRCPRHQAAATCGGCEHAVSALLSGSSSALSATRLCSVARYGLTASSQRLAQLGGGAANKGSTAQRGVRVVLVIRASPPCRARSSGLLAICSPRAALEERVLPGRVAAAPGTASPSR
jgi:hypothetical protein